MRTYLLSVLLGLTTVAVWAPLPAQAEPRVYQFESGKESLRLDPEGFDVLKSLGLSLDSVENTAVPAPGYTYGEDLVGSTFTFSYDDVTEEFIGLGGTVDFTGSVFFDVDTTKLDLPPQLVVGNFSAAVEPDAPFTVVDTIATGLPIFNLEPSGPVVVDLESQTVTLNFEATASQEFSDFLVDAGASTPIAGVKLLDIQGDRNIAEVPEPSSVLGILMAGAAIAVRLWRRTA